MEYRSVEEMLGYRPTPEYQSKLTAGMPRRIPTGVVWPYMSEFNLSSLKQAYQDRGEEFRCRELKAVRRREPLPLKVQADEASFRASLRRRGVVRSSLEPNAPDVSIRHPVKQDTVRLARAEGRWVAVPSWTPAEYDDETFWRIS